MQTKEILFEYFTVQEANLFVFYRIPKELFTNPRYKKLSAEAKLLYGLLLDRNGLSLQNGWVDNEGHIYIYFSRDEAMEMLGIGTEKVVKLFKELNEVGLIKEVRQGLNKPNIIYVGKFIASNADVPTDFRKSKLRTFENQNSGLSDIETQDFRISKSNNTDINKTYLNENKISQSVSPGTEETTQVFCQTTDRQTDILPPGKTEQQELECIYENAQTPLYTARLFIENVIKKLYTNGNMPYILKMELTHTDIQDRLRLLTHAHIDAALAKMVNVKTNKELYFAKCLLTAIVEVDLDKLLQEEVQEPTTSSNTEKIPQRDAFEQREYSDEELERFYANLN